VRLAFSFQTKYLGMSPFRCPSLFTILSFLEYEYGVFHPIGGCGAVSEAMAALARRMGVEIRLETPVDRILYEAGEAVGVEAGGERLATGAVVVNGDFGHTVRRLIPDGMRRAWPDRKIDKAKLSCSTFMLYLGLEGDVGDLELHTIVLSQDYERNIHEISNGTLPDRPSFYVQHAGRTDPGLAPPGHTSLYVLVPVPNLRCNVDWGKETPRYRRLVLDRLKLLGLSDLERRIRYERVVTPRATPPGRAAPSTATTHSARSAPRWTHARSVRMAAAATRAPETAMSASAAGRTSRRAALHAPASARQGTPMAGAGENPARRPRL
jgi:phytoene desaturase